jgi:hypothetical protein
MLREGEKNNSEDEGHNEAPEDSIPDLPENHAARQFLSKAPTKGLWLPMGVEVKVMQCFRCKAYGHRSGDRECPLTKSGNVVLDAERQVMLVVQDGFIAGINYLFFSGPRRSYDDCNCLQKENARRKVC